MSIDTARQFAKGFTLLSSILMITACGTKLPFTESPIEDTSKRSTLKAQTSKAQTAETKSRYEVVYDAVSPQTYIVQKGDTLWDISSTFLRDPWFWPEIWYKNPQVNNPHLIYPGDTLAIVYVGGQKRVQLQTRGEEGQYYQGEQGQFNGGNGGNGSNRGNGGNEGNGSNGNNWWNGGNGSSGSNRGNGGNGSSGNNRGDGGNGGNGNNRGDGGNGSSGGSEGKYQLENRGEENIFNNVPGGMSIVKVNPLVRATSIESSIPSIPIDAIRHLLARPILIDDNTLRNSAYVVSSRDDHLINSINDTLYVRNLNTGNGSGLHHIYRPDRPLFDPDTNELLGFQALFIGETKLLKRGDPSSVRVTNSEREILRNDRILPINNTTIDRDFFPTPPATDVVGRIITLIDAISQVGQYQTIALNLGQRDGVETGNILKIWRRGNTIRDNAPQAPSRIVKLPDEEVGMAMIILSFEKLSYALIMDADSPVSMDDYLRTP